MSLTAGSDVKTGTTGNDTFDGSTAGTLNTADVLSDGSTTDADVLNATINAAPAAGAANASATVANIETINVNGQFVTTGYNAFNTTGAKEIKFAAGISGATATLQDASAGATAKVTAGSNIQTLNVNTNATTNTTNGLVTVDAGAATTVALTGATGADTYNLTVGSGATAINLTADTGTDAFTVNLSGNTATLTVDAGGNIEQLTLNNTGAASTITLAGGPLVGAAAAGNKATLSGSGDITISANFANLTTLKIEDTGTAKTTLKTSVAVGAAADLSKATVDVVQLNNTITGFDVTVNNGSTVLLSADIGASAGDTLQVQNAAGTISNVAGNRGTLTVDVKASQTLLETGDQVGTLKLSNTSATAATTLTAFTAHANTDSVVLTGSKDMTVTTLTTNGGSFDGTNFTGKLTVGTIVGNDNVVVGGASNDALTATTNSLTGLVLVGNGGNDLLDASGLTTAGGATGAVIDGGTGNDTLRGGEAVDTISGGDADDLIVGGLGADILTGGAGNDTFQFANFTALTTGDATAAAFETITDFASGDKIDLASDTIKLIANPTSGGVAAGADAVISATGLATFNAATTTLANKITAVEAGINAGGTAAAGQSAVFVHDGATYLFVSDGTDNVANTDLLVKLVGVTATTGITLDGSGDIIAIA